MWRQEFRHILNAFHLNEEYRYDNIHSVLVYYGPGADLLNDQTVEAHM